MAETLGSLCDKLIVVKLKVYHTSIDDRERMEKLSTQDMQLRREINEYIRDAVAGYILTDKLTFESNKIHDGVVVPHIPSVSIAGSISTLTEINCDIWHLQEKMYNFTTVSPEKKDCIITDISKFNVQRNNCIDDINERFKELLK